MPSEFSRALFAFLLGACYAAEAGAGSGWDPSAEWSHTRADRAKDALAAAATRAGFARRRFDLEPAAAELAETAARLPGLERTYGLLADDASRELLVRLLVFRALGPHHVALPVRPDELTAAAERIEREQRVPGASVPSPYGGELGVYESAGVRMHTHPLAVHEFFELEQYAHRAGCVAPEPGDVAIDGGGGWGDTALWLAYRVGSAGRVVCAEVDEANRTLIATNLALNPELATRIEVLPKALWSASGESVEYAVAGPSSSLVETGRSDQHARVETVRVDDLGLERVDFLKLDVEGAELDALRGAEDTLRRFRPKLAVAAYHGAGDLVDLPAFVDGLGLGYRFHLGHYTPGREETILFARVDPQR